MSIHDGHRERVKREFLAIGIDHFSETRILELVLFYSRRQGDVNPLAHELLNTFGSLAGVMDASPEDLMAVPGVGENTAVLLKLFPAMISRYMLSRTDPKAIITDAASIRELMAPYFFSARNEMTYLACLDGKRKLLGVRKIGEGEPNAIDISPRQLAMVALSLNASSVVLAHNHPSGVATPSKEDTSTTRYLIQVLAGVSIELYDHVIFADGDMVSFRESGRLFTLM